MPGYDLGVIGLAPAGRFAGVSASLAPFDGQSGRVSGLAKLSQTVIFLFTTELGSIALDPDSGASPLGELKRIGLYEKEQIDGRLASAAAAIRQEIQNMQTSNADPEEQLAELSIISTEIDASSASIFVEISLSSVAGNAAAYTTTLSLE